MTARICLVVLAAMLTASAFQTNDSLMNNARVIEMTKLGLGNDVIIARIKISRDQFQLADTDLAALKKAGVSDAVVAAMLESSVIRVPEASIDGHALALETLGESKVGGRLGHDLSFGFRSVKEKAYLPGKAADVTVGPHATIQLTLPPTGTIDNFLVVHMDQKSDRREIEVASGGGEVGQKSGIRDEAIERVNVTPEAPGTYTLTPLKPLKPGQYFIYWIGSADSIHAVWGKGFAFGVSKKLE